MKFNEVESSGIKHAPTAVGATPVPLTQCRFSFTQSLSCCCFQRTVKLVSVRPFFFSVGGRGCKKTHHMKTRCDSSSPGAAVPPARPLLDLGFLIPYTSLRS